MLKYKGFPSRMPGSDYQFTIRRANPKGATKLIKRERYRDRKFSDKTADKAFLTELVLYFGEKSFERGCLDAGRLSWFFGREIVAVSDPFDPYSYEALLMLNLDLVRISLPEIVV
jgi:hypothetical protein